MSTIRERVDAIDWSTVTDGLDELGIASTGPMLDTDECNTLIELYDCADRFRSTIDMASHRFGRRSIPILQPASTSHSLPSCERRSGRTCFLSPATGPNVAGSPARGLTPSTNGSINATPPGSYGRRH